MTPAPDAEDQPGALADPAEMARRRTLLSGAHMRSLADYVCELRARGAGYVPDFDPLDGGVRARLLLLLEKPGPKTFPPRGSGFVSRDTNDPTARAIHRFMLQAEAPRRETVLWNIVPWWNGAIAMTAAEKRLGALEVPALLARLPELRGVILAGNAAWELGAAQFRDAGLPLFRCVHPSPQARAGPASSERWLQLPQIWREAWRTVG